MVDTLTNMIAIVKPVGNWCNLRCEYCFHYMEDLGTKRIMDLGLLEKFCREYFSLPFKIFVFSWHGGEPLLADPSFFKEVIRLQQQFLPEGKAVRNGIQTNGTLINEEWAKFFQENNFGVGVSLDGAKASHDQFRVDSGDYGSFEKAMGGIKILRENGVNPGIIQTLTYTNLPRITENLQFFVENELKSIGINPYLGLGNNGIPEQHITNGEFIKFLKTCIDFWLELDDEHFQIREIDSFLAGLLGKQACSPCDFNGYCYLTFTVEYNGKVYPCDRFSGREELFWGDLNQQSLQEILDSPNRQKWVEGITALPAECKSCKWQAGCRNGCTYLRPKGVGEKYYYCRTRKEIFSFLEIKLKKYREEIK